MSARLHVAGVLLLLATSCSPPQAAAAQGGQGGPGGTQPRQVRLGAVGEAKLPRELDVPGALAAQEELTLALEVGGRLRTLAVDVGDTVAPGVLLADLDPRDLELAVARAEASIVAATAKLGVAADADLAAYDVDTAPAVREAQAQLQEAKLQRDRAAAMVQQNAQSGSVLDTAVAALAVAESRVAKARDEVKTGIADVKLRRIERAQAEKRLADSRAVAPFAGRVAQRHVSAGQVVAAGQPLLTLLRIQPLRLRLRISERDGAGVAIGQRVDFTVDGVAGPARSGRVVRTGPLIDRGDRTRLVEAEVDNAAGDLLPGAFCRARIVLAEGEPAMVVPRSAVVTFAGVDRVFTVGDGKSGGKVAKGAIVEIGRELGDTVEIVRGLPKGARIVVEAKGLTPETPVVVAE